MPCFLSFGWEKYEDALKLVGKIVKEGFKYGSDQNYQYRKDEDQKGKKCFKVIYLTTKINEAED